MKKNLGGAGEHGSLISQLHVSMMHIHEQHQFIPTFVTFDSPYICFTFLFPGIVVSPPNGYEKKNTLSAVSYPANAV